MDWLDQLIDQTPPAPAPTQQPAPMGMSTGGDWLDHIIDTTPPASAPSPGFMQQAVNTTRQGVDLGMGALRQTIAAPAAPVPWQTPTAVAPGYEQDAAQFAPPSLNPRQQLEVTEAQQELGRQFTGLPPGGQPGEFWEKSRLADEEQQRVVLGAATRLARAKGDPTILEQVKLKILLRNAGGQVPDGYKLVPLTLPGGNEPAGLGSTPAGRAASAQQMARQQANAPEARRRAYFQQLLLKQRQAIEANPDAWAAADAGDVYDLGNGMGLVRVGATKGLTPAAQGQAKDGYTVGGDVEAGWKEMKGSVARTAGGVGNVATNAVNPRSIAGQLLGLPQNPNITTAGQQWSQDMIAGGSAEMQEANQMPRSAFGQQVSGLATNLGIPMLTGPAAPLTAGAMAMGRTNADVYQQLLAQGVPEQEARRQAFLPAVASGAAEGVAWAGVPKAMHGAMPKFMAPTGNIGKLIGQEALTGGGFGLAGIPEKMITAQATGGQVDWNNLPVEVLESAAMGIVLGGAFKLKGLPHQRAVDAYMAEHGLPPEARPAADKIIRIAQGKQAGTLVDPQNFADMMRAPEQAAPVEPTEQPPARPNVQYGQPSRPNPRRVGPFEETRAPEVADATNAGAIPAELRSQYDFAKEQFPNLSHAELVEKARDLAQFEDKNATPDFSHLEPAGGAKEFQVEDAPEFHQQAAQTVLKGSTSGVLPKGTTLQSGDGGLALVNGAGLRVPVRVVKQIPRLAGEQNIRNTIESIAAHGEGGGGYIKHRFADGSAGRVYVPKSVEEFQRLPEESQRDFLEVVNSRPETQAGTYEEKTRTIYITAEHVNDVDLWREELGHALLHRMREANPAQYAALIAEHGNEENAIKAIDPASPPEQAAAAGAGGTSPAPARFPPRAENVRERRPLSEYTPIVHTEQSAENALRLLDEKAHGLEKTLYVSNDPDLAAGQGENRGVRMEFDTSKLTGTVNTAKPGWELQYDQGKAEFLTGGKPAEMIPALRSVTVDPAALTADALGKRLRVVVLPNLKAKGFTQTKNADGSVTWTRGDVAADDMRARFTQQAREAPTEKLQETLSSIGDTTHPSNELPRLRREVLEAELSRRGVEPKPKAHQNDPELMGRNKEPAKPAPLPPIESLKLKQFNEGPFEKQLKGIRSERETIRLQQRHREKEISAQPETKVAVIKAKAAVKGGAGKMDRLRQAGDQAEFEAHKADPQWAEWQDQIGKLENRQDAIEQKAEAQKKAHYETQEDALRQQLEQYSVEELQRYVTEHAGSSEGSIASDVLHPKQIEQNRSAREQREQIEQPQEGEVLQPGYEPGRGLKGLGGFGKYRGSVARAADREAAKPDLSKVQSGMERGPAELKKAGKVQPEYGVRFISTENLPSHIADRYNEGFARLKEFIKIVPEFALDPNFTVVGEGEAASLQFQDGGRYKFFPQSIGIRLPDGVKAGDRVGVDIETVKKLKKGQLLDATPTGKEKEESPEKNLAMRSPGGASAREPMGLGVADAKKAKGIRDEIKAYRAHEADALKDGDQQGAANLSRHIRGLEEDLAKLTTGQTAAPAAQKLAIVPLADFARAVQRVADASDKGFGKNKVFISDAYDAAKKLDPSLTLEQFKMRLVDANRQGLVTLARADLVAAMHPDDVARSETKYLNGSFNFILAEPKERTWRQETEQEGRARLQKSADAYQAKEAARPKVGSMADAEQYQRAKAEARERANQKMAMPSNEDLARGTLHPKIEPATKEGVRLVESIKQDAAGDHVGLRSIVQSLADAVHTTIYPGKTQTTATNPAHYNPGRHYIRSRSPGWQYNFHEIGHALSNMVRDKKGNGLLDLHEPELKALAVLPADSIASAPSAEEGLAEWVRRYVVAPDTIPPSLKRSISEAIGEASPKILNALNDARAAYEVHTARPIEAQLRSYSKDLPPPKTVGEKLEDFKDWTLYTLAGGNATIQARIDKRVFKGLSQVGRAFARQFGEKIKNTPLDYQSAMQTLLHIPQEASMAIHGVNKGREGIRVYSTGKGFGALSDASLQSLMSAGFKLPAEATKHGEWVWLTDKSYDAIKRDVGEKDWEGFETYGQYRTALHRFEEKGHRYPGLTEGFTPERLRGFIEDQEAAHPQWAEQYKAVNEWMDQLLLVNVLGGAMNVPDAIRVKKAYEDYWPLNRIPSDRPQSTAGGGVNPDFGVRRAWGSDLPFKSLDEAVETRTKKAMEAYYTNRAILSLAKLTDTVARAKDVPLEAKADIAQLMLPLHLEAQKVATLTTQEQAKVIADHLNQEHAKEMGIGVDELPADILLKPEDVDINGPLLDVWRHKRPNAVRVVAPLENGNRKFYQVTDPLVFEYFARTENVHKAIKWLTDLGAGVLRPWKRAITQNILFTLRNVPRDVGTAMIMGGDRRSLVPGYYAAQGVVSRLLGKGANRADAMANSELMSRAFEATNSKTHLNLWNAFKEKLKEDVVIPGWKDMSTGAKIGAVPGAIYAAAMKPVEIPLWLTGQHRLSQLSEALPREGAFEAARKAGESPERAQREFDRITGNFGDRPGNATMAAVYRSVGFLNPGIQIFHGMIERLSHYDPKTRAFHWAKLPYITALAAGAAAMNYLMLDDKAKEKLRERPVNERMRSMAVGGLVSLPFDGGPMGAAASFGWNAAESAMLNDKGNGPDIARGVLMRLLDMPGPTDIIHPWIKTAIEEQANYSFYKDSHIVPPMMERSFKDNPAAQTFSDTPRTYQVIGDLLGASPIKVNYAVRNLFTAQFDDTVKLAEQLLNGRGKPIHQPSDLPYIGRLFQRDPSGWHAKSVKTLGERETQFDALKKLYEPIAQRVAQAKAKKEAIDPEDEAQAKELGDQIRALQNAHDAMLEVERNWRAVKAEMKKPKPDQAKIDLLEKKMVDLAKVGLNLPAKAPAPAAQRKAG